MRFLAACGAPPKQKFIRGTRVVVRTSRGLEVGEVLCEATERTAAMSKSTEEGQIFRAMSREDEHELTRIHDQEKEEFQICSRCIGQLQLAMQLVDVEHLFGGERIVVYYLAESRVDFRELVRMLAGEFQTRIEMRQIGVRDEAKLMADYGDCGNPVCCNNHLSGMPPVSMKMAKLQKATLDPTKISGRCGRLKCCLRYEFETYEQLQKELPPIGARIQTPDGRGRVIGHEILTSKILVETEDRTRKLIDASTVSSPSAQSGSKDSGKVTEPDRSSSDST